ncbi:MAG: CHAT domain-containing protein [Planctomycetota bacterium]
MRTPAQRGVGVEERHKPALTGVPPAWLSGLVLAGANRPPGQDRDDGYLTAKEIASLDLTCCDLVLLSASETAVGTQRGGEGMLSVRRALREAGAGTVIASLWKVRDEETRRLVTDFYERLWTEGASPLPALRDAQLALLAENRRRGLGPRPFTWGAFVLSGEWR